MEKKVARCKREYRIGRFRNNVNNTLAVTVTVRKEGAEKILEDNKIRVLCGKKGNTEKMF